MTSDILTVEEVAEYLKLAKKTVYKLAAEKRSLLLEQENSGVSQKTEIEE